MKKRLLPIVMTLVVLTSGSLVSAEEPVVAFVQGLRTKGYYDTAEEYLDRVAQDPAVPADVKKRIPYERAVVLSDSARSQRNIEMRYRQLDRAAAELDKFIKNNSGHELMGDAQSRRGAIFIGRAEAAIIESQSSGNAGRRPELEKQAHDYIEQARKIFSSAKVEHEKSWKQFDKYIPPDQKEKLARRLRALVNLMTARLDFAKTFYHEAQVHKQEYEPKRDRYLEKWKLYRGTPGKEEGKKEKVPLAEQDRRDAELKRLKEGLEQEAYYKLLDQAAREFDKIHADYRSQVGGLYAQMWQGKCFEEQDEIGRALGIYDELLAHPAKSRALVNLQHQALSFKLICLNHVMREDYLLVEQSASGWLTRNRTFARTTTGLQVRYELARAREQLGLKPDLKEPEQRRYLAQALQDAQYVNQFPGKFKDATTLMIARLKGQLGMATEAPRTFADAFSRAKISYQKLREALVAYDAAIQAGKPDDEIKMLRDKVGTQIDETTSMLQLGLKLVKPEDTQESVNQARQILAYSYLLQANHLDRIDRAYDAAVLAEFLARNQMKESPDVARDAAYMAMSAYGTLYNNAPAGRQDIEMQWIIGIALHIIKHWPNSERAIDATRNLGQMYNQKGDYLQAGRWYSRVPASAKDRYATGLLNAGTNFWGHYDESVRSPQTANGFRRVLRDSVGDEWAEAVADTMNPSWAKWHRLQQEEEVDAFLNERSAQANPKKNAKQPDGAAKGKAGATPRQTQIAALKKESLKELKEALQKVTGQAPADAPEPELRDKLVAALSRKTEPQLKQQFEDWLAGLSGEEDKEEIKEKKTPDQKKASEPKTSKPKSKSTEPGKSVEEKKVPEPGNAAGKKKDLAALRSAYNDKLNQLRAMAAWYLATGIKEWESQTTDESQVNEDYIRAKAVFSDYAIQRGRYHVARALLVTEPEPAKQDVVTAMSVPDGAKRPPDGIKSRGFAGAVYQTLARAYIGTKELDKFKDAITKLEKVLGSGNQDDLARVYRDLGNTLQREFERLEKGGDKARLEEEIQNFSWVVDALFENKAQLDYGLLRWIGQTAFALGSGIQDPGSAGGYFKQAAEAYQQILDKQTDLKVGQRLAIRLRLIECRRRQQEYEQTIDLVKALLADLAAQKRNPIDVHQQAAYTFQAWAKSGQTDKYLLAIGGVEEEGKPEVYGWKQIADELRRGRDGTDPDKDGESKAQYNRYYDDYLEARFSLVWCRYQYGMAQAAEPKRNQALVTAKQEILSFANLSGKIADRQFLSPRTGKREDARGEFETLYGMVLSNLGAEHAEPARIEWPTFVAVKVGAGKKKVAGNGSDPKPMQEVKAEKPKEEKKKQSGGSGFLGMVFGALFAIALLAGGGWFLFKSMGKEKKRSLVRAYAGGGPTFGERSASGSTGGTAKRKSSSGGKTSGGKSSGSRPGGSRQPSAKKQPTGQKKPPSGKPAPKKGPPPST